MAPFKQKLPMSAALRQGGEGVVPPPKPQEDAFDLGSIKGPKSRMGPKAPTKIGKGVDLPKIPKLKTPRLK